MDKTRLQELAGIEQLNEANKIENSKTKFAVRDIKTGEFYSEGSTGSLDDAKLWSSKTGAEKTAREWGSSRRPQQHNEIVEVIERIAVTRKAGKVVK